MIKIKDYVLIKNTDLLLQVKDIVNTNIVLAEPEALSIAFCSVLSIDDLILVRREFWVNKNKIGSKTQVTVDYINNTIKIADRHADGLSICLDIKDLIS